MMHKCNLCEKQGFRFERKYRPEEYIEGYAESPVWIVGLNPAHEKDYIDEKTADEVARDLIEIKLSSKYFRDFRGVSLSLFEAIGKEGGVAHTDIVKCFGRSFPKGKMGKTITNNCQDYLRSQIQRYKPKLIICNGSRVSDYIGGVLQNPGKMKEQETSYICSKDGYRVCVVLSGFLGRIDRHARRRLGAEIHLRMEELGISIDK